MRLLMKDEWEKVNGVTGVGSKGQKRNKNRVTCVRRRSGRQARFAVSPIPEIGLQILNCKLGVT